MNSVLARLFLPLALFLPAPRHAVAGAPSSSLRLTLGSGPTLRPLGFIVLGPEWTQSVRGVTPRGFVVGVRSSLSPNPSLVLDLRAQVDGTRSSGSRSRIEIVAEVGSAVVSPQSCGGAFDGGPCGLEGPLIGIRFAALGRLHQSAWLGISWGVGLRPGAFQYDLGSLALPFTDVSIVWEWGSEAN